VNHYYIVYNSGEGTGSDVIDNNSGSYYSTAPSAIAFPSSFTAPSHKSFSGWSPASVSFASATEDASKQTYTNATNTTDKYYYVTLTAQYVSDTGSLKITKVLNSDAPSSAASKVYSFTVTGPNGYDNTVTITGAGSKTIGSLLTGEYKVTEKNAGIGGYVLNIAYSTTDGKATVTKDGTADVTVTNSYSAIAVPLATYTLTVNWLDDEGNSLRAQEVTKNITSGSDYAAVQHAFEGYTFSKMATGSDAASGKMTGDKTVTFIYTKTAPTNPEGDITDPENPTPSPGVPANPEGDITIVDDDVPTSDSPQTGDSNNPFLLLAIMAGCVLGIVGIAVGNRKKRSNG
jgi:LPXTG-motif cell wall-anchored protein